MIRTVVICIGNSDDKLTQKEWSDYCTKVEHVVDTFGIRVFAKTYSLNPSQYQNASFVFELDEIAFPDIRKRLTNLAVDFVQDSIAFVVGDTDMIPGVGNNA